MFSLTHCDTKSTKHTHKYSPDKHLVDEYAKCPPVHHLRVASPLNDLWGQVLRSPTQCVCPSE